MAPPGIMVAVKAHQAESFLKAPDKRITAFLFYGPDAGLVSERSEGLARRIAAIETPSGEVLRLDDADLEADPDRLFNELGMVPMFGGRKIVRVTTGRRINAPHLKPLVEDGKLAGILIVEGGNLKPDESMRLLFEKPAHAAAIPCYADEASDVAGLVREMLAAAKMSIAPEALQLLVTRLGADRALTRGEVEKLILYANGTPRIEAGHVDAIVGDAAELAVDAIVLAAAAGDAGAAVRECGRAVEAGENAQMIILALLRHFQRLHRLRVALDAGKSFDDAVRGLRPPLYFKHKPLVGAQTRHWTAPALAAAMTEISATLRSARLAGALDEPMTERLLWSLAERVKRAGGATRGPGR
ncbi:MAG: DNA polymerase III subunit delta [Hyphomicrobium sp.]